MISPRHSPKNAQSCLKIFSSYVFLCKIILKKNKGCEKIKSPLKKMLQMGTQTKYDQTLNIGHIQFLRGTMPSLKTAIQIPRRTKLKVL